MQHFPLKKLHLLFERAKQKSGIKNYSMKKTKKNHRRNSVVFIGSPTWDRTTDQQINRNFGRLKSVQNQWLINSKVTV